MKYTNNYNWALPGRIDPEDDRADIEVLNDNFVGIDTTVAQIRVDLTGAQNTITSHVANLSNPHQTTAAQVGSYTIAQVDALIEALQAAVDEATSGSSSLADSLAAHLSNLNNPHQTTAAQVGAYTTAEVNDLIGDFLSHGGIWEPDRIVVTDSDGELVITAGTSTEELAYLEGLTGNVQQQINNIASLTPTYELRGTIIYQYNTATLPDQDALNTQAVSLIEAEYPSPVLFDTYVVSFTNNDETEGRVCGYAYYDGTTPNGVTGWVLYYVTTTTVALADGTKAGIVRSSADISFTGGSGVVNHAAEADLAEAAKGLVSTQLGSSDAPSTDLNTYYGLEHDALFWAGAGNTVTNKPSGVDAFGIFVQRVADGRSAQILYASGSEEYSGLWTREYNGTWGAWRAPLADLNARNNASTAIADLTTNPSTWPVPRPSGNIEVTTRGIPYAVRGAAETVGLPEGFANTWAGSIMFTTTSSTGYNPATLVIHRSQSSSVGVSIQTAIKYFTADGAWTEWHTFGNNLGSAAYPYNTVYATAISQTNASALTLGSSDNIIISSHGSSKLVADVASLRPVLANNGALDLGRNDAGWRNIYATGKINAGSASFTGNVTAATPTAANHLATKAYVDSAAGGGGGGKKYSTVVVGSAAAGYTAEDVDFLYTSGDAATVLQQANDAAATNQGTVKILSGTYSLASSVIVTTSWAGESNNGAKLTYPSTGTSDTLQIATTRVTLENLYLDGVAIRAGALYTEFTLLNCYCINAIVQCGANRSKIVGCTFETGSRSSTIQTVQLPASYCLVSNCAFYITAQYATSGVLALQSSFTRVIGCIFSNPSATALSSARPVIAINGSYSTIQGCTFAALPLGILVSDGEQHAINGNAFSPLPTSQSTSLRHISVENSVRFVSITGNAAYGYTAGYLVYAASTTSYVAVTGNVVRSSQGIANLGTGAVTQLNIIANP